MFGIKSKKAEVPNQSMTIDTVTNDEDILDVPEEEAKGSDFYNNGDGFDDSNEYESQPVKQEQPKVNLPRPVQRQSPQRQVQVERKPEIDSEELVKVISAYKVAIEELSNTMEQVKEAINNLDERTKALELTNYRLRGSY